MKVIKIKRPTNQVICENVMGAGTTIMKSNSESNRFKRTATGMTKLAHRLTLVFAVLCRLNPITL